MRNFLTFSTLSSASHVLAVFAISVIAVSPVNAQSGFFDGDFESGTFQGWTPGGEQGGFATLAAKGSCYSANDTTAISFNGNERSNYAALLRSNAQGGTDSVATLRSQPFPAGSAVYFSALTESPSLNVNRSPVEFVVRILDSAGEELAALPYRTALIQLAPGCPSEQRDATFSIHSVPTHQFDGDIMIEFRQSTRILGRGLFTLIDDVFTLPKNDIVLSRSQPRAVAGTSVTSSGTLFLDPSDSFDPDQAPEALNYRWRIDGENFMRELDFPCVFVGGGVAVGNNRATLYVDDGFHYSADTLNFVVPAGTSTGTSSNSTTASTNTNTDSNITLTAPRGGPVGSDSTATASDGSAIITDPRNECDIDFSENPGTDGDTPDGNNDSGSDGGGSTALSIDPNGSNSGSQTVDYTIGGNPVSITNGASITNANGGTVERIVVSISNGTSQSGDQLDVSSTQTTLSVSNNAPTSITITPASGSAEAEADFEAQLNSIRFSNSENNVSTATRTITISVEDGVSTATATVTVNVQN
ncbi:MAG: hypothetical protein AAF402_15095 [Pseudomonadota bacterium]